MKAELSNFFNEVRPAVDATLDRLLPSADASPSPIHEAMRYSVFAGGKRLRPALCVAAYSVFQPEWTKVLPAASAIEMVHTYSLIHDDLPSMDDDDFRRGRPSCHKKFGEATAILAGDGLLTLAFETLASQRNFAADRMLRVLWLLAGAAGTSRGMIAGQVMDLAAEGAPVGPAQLESIHRFKTGALINASLHIGAYLGGASAGELEIVSDFGGKVGLAFQIVDDILDETESNEALGKTAGKDREKKKVTYPALHGLGPSRAMVRQLTDDARAIARRLGGAAGVLADMAGYLETRSN